MLRKLILDNNLIEDIDISGLSHLRELSIQNNKIVTLDGISKATNLHYLNLSGNPLNSL